MPPSPPDPAGPRSGSRPAARLERVLAVGRAFLTVTGFVAIYLDPTEPARLQAVTYGVLFAYAVYSLAVLAFTGSRIRITPAHGRLLHGLDILWTSALTFVSEGPVSPFFLFFLFVVLAAAYRWGFRETVGTAVVTSGVFLLETTVAAIGPWSWAVSIEFELNRTILRVAYLLLTGVLLGYLAEEDKHHRAELAAIADAARQSPVNIGLGRSVTTMARALMRRLDAASAAMVVHDHESRRALLWMVAGPADQAGAARLVRRIELEPSQQAAWLFPDPGRAWHAVVKDPGSVALARVAEPDVWRLRRVPVRLPQGLFEARPFRTITAVNMGLSGEWQARVYLFDASAGGSLERRLHFLEALADHVTPALTNVFLLRRLRARSGAAERARVARELHDGAIQALFGIDMKIEAIRRESGDGSGEVAAELAEVQQLLRREVLALRELMQALRPVEIDSGEQLPDVLAGLVERFRRDTGIPARFISTAGRVLVPPAKAIEIIRIVQEALVNARKHSDARNVLVRLTGGDGRYRLVVEDDGRGFAFEGRLTAEELDRQRLGPAIIKERARVAGAELAVDSTPGAGTRVELSFAEDAHA